MLESSEILFGHVKATKMYKRNVAYKCFLIFVVLFCAYMQWSPVVDLDYVWINGHEHYVGATTPHQTGKVVVPILLQPVGRHPAGFALDLLLPLPAEQSMAPRVPCPTLRL
jgi:hypothetical protein